jgi:hypothetical protein
MEYGKYYVRRLSISDMELQISLFKLVTSWTKAECSKVGTLDAYVQRLP